MKNFTLLILLSALFLLPFFAFAVVPEEGVISLPNPLSAANFTELIESITNWLLVITAPIVVLIIVFAGFQYMTGTFSPTLEKQTSPESIRQARKMITYALLGYIIILLSKVLLAVITGLFS